MSGVETLFNNLWLQYTAINPQAEAIHQLLTERGETVVNDHIAIRTFNTQKLGIDSIAQVFVDLGYVKKDAYDFSSKKLNAFHYEHPENPNHPKVFISELQVEAFSEEVQEIIKKLDDQVDVTAPFESDFIYSGRPWELTFDDYIRLLQESEYAAWTAAFGYRANHFTVSINHLTTFFDIESLNDFILNNDFAMNESGGLIKGTPEQLLEQSSTMAPLVNLAFSDANHLVPSCFYEFAKRYPMDSGRLYQGFIAASADKIFESTDAK
ncbi:DUF1338 domain-containing protein [Marinicella rhabdoformis]|uniref:DUF1338 domain-containing protein n=1 Tax=Marinicella rhabdoformis TaxID=2580566 RepID=UPI0012AEB690|nr:DUF1338 domain-containing protein [Marinicella rhabdoformis]